MPREVSNPRGVAFRLALAVALVAAAAVASPGGSGDDAPGTQAPPEEISYPSTVGEVHFPHAFHIDDLEIACEDCHHPVEAPKLTTPHPQYFRECGVDCATCHRGELATATAHRCQACHGPTTQHRCDHVSTKVAVHRMCSGCHEIGTGSEASRSCENCHTGPHRPW